VRENAVRHPALKGTGRAPHQATMSVELTFRSSPAMRFSARAVMVTALLGIVACGDDDGSPSSTGVDAVIANVATNVPSATVARRIGSAPAAGAAAAPVAALVNAVINGGTSTLRVSRTAAFTRLIVGVQGRPGYYEVTFPTGVTAADLALTIADSARAGSLQFNVAAGTSATELSTYQAVTSTLVQVGSGDIQVSASWDTRTDVDLNVTDPSGNTVSYSADSVASGGKLDLDSNPGCAIDNVNQENITWPSGRAPRGQYIVRINLWSRCSVTGNIPWTVTVKVAGQATRTFTGNLSTVIASAGVGTEVVRFTY
jgi:uncharacterized protein YfaP (DUF2135 family)